MKPPGRREFDGPSHQVLAEIPHFLNKSTDGITSVTIDDMPTFGWVGSFFWLEYILFGWTIIIIISPILVGLPPGIVSLLTIFVA